MILDILCIRNKAIKSYAQPYFSQEKLENQEANMYRTLVLSPEARVKYKNCALYHFGTFNDETGKYDLLPEPELLFDCDDLVASIPEK